MKKFYRSKTPNLLNICSKLTFIHEYDHTDRCLFFYILLSKNKMCLNFYVKPFCLYCYQLPTWVITIWIGTLCYKKLLSSDSPSIISCESSSVKKKNIYTTII